MKRKLALLLTVTMLATSVYTPWLANAAEFTSGEENSLYTEEKPETEEIEEEPEADTEEAGEEEVQEDILSDENTDTGEAEEIQPSAAKHIAVHSVTGNTLRDAQDTYLRSLSLHTVKNCAKISWIGLYTYSLFFISIFLY